MPLEPSVFPEEVQMAFFISDLVSEKWDGMSGMYMGKNWTETTQLFHLYEVDNRRDVLYFMKLHDSLLQRKRHEDQKRKEKKNKTKGGDGTTYTHRIQG